MTEKVKAAIEIVILAAVIYALLRAVRPSRNSGLFRGLGILLLTAIATFAVLLEALKLTRIEQLFVALSDLALLGVLIVFQPELRRGVIRLGETPLFSRLLRREPKRLQRLLRAVARMSKERIGALIAIEREASLGQYLESGIQLDAELNSYLIESLFHPGTALHDGAMVIRGDRIVGASCILPLSQSQDIDKRLGTRHRAALGLAEQTDALTIIVSEETGKISTASHGRLRFGISMEELEHTIERALGLEVEG